MESFSELDRYNFVRGLCKTFYVNLDIMKDLLIESIFAVLRFFS